MKFPNWKTCLLGFVAVSIPLVHAVDTKKPNIVLILADDLGYECVGPDGCTSYKTPALDKLAANGVRFDACYAQPVCTPTRVQIMTGKYNVRNYVDFGAMDAESVTFANILKKAGYATCMAGKWQLGTDLGLPKKFGFDEYCLWQHTRTEKDKCSRYMNPGLEINGVARDFTNKEYGPDVVSNYALDFIQREKDKPFFLYYTMMLTHGPYDATPESSDYGQKQPHGKRSMDARPDGIIQHFSDMVEHTDKLVGKLLAKLDELGIRDNTIVIFLGDNGTAKGTMSLMGDRKVYGGKGMPTDAGMHVPLIVSWPTKSAVGKVSTDLVDTTDFLPTLCDVAGVPVPEGLKIDGRSFLPQVLGKKGNPRDWYYSWYAPKGEMMAEFAATRDYKLSRTGEFYDLRNDLAETHPLKVLELSGEAAAAAKLLQGALDQYKDARPANLPKPADASKKVERKKGKNKTDEINKTDEENL